MSDHENTRILNKRLLRKIKLHEGDFARGDIKPEDFVCKGQLEGFHVITDNEGAYRLVQKPLDSLASASTPPQTQPGPSSTPQQTLPGPSSSSTSSWAPSLSGYTGFTPSTTIQDFGGPPRGTKHVRQPAASSGPAQTPQQVAKPTRSPRLSAFKQPSKKATTTHRLAASASPGPVQPTVGGYPAASSSPAEGRLPTRDVRVAEGIVSVQKREQPFQSSGFPHINTFTSQTIADSLEPKGLDKATYPGTGIYVSIDLHNTLDDGSNVGAILGSAIEGCKILLNLGFTLWVNSYIGFWGKNSEALRLQAAERVKELARILNLQYTDDFHRGPRQGHLLLVVVDRKLYSFHHHHQLLNGKVSAISALGTVYHFDDCPEICQQLLQQGYLSYHIVSWKNKAVVADALLGFYHTSSRNFLEAVNRFVSEFLAGVADNKLEFLWAKPCAEPLPHLPYCILQEHWHHNH